MVRGSRVEVNMLPKIKFEIVVSTEEWMKKVVQTHFKRNESEQPVFFLHKSTKREFSGSSSTKYGFVKGDNVVLDETVDHDRSEFAACETFADQKPIRMRLIKEALAAKNVDLSEVDAVVGRGVGLFACEGGTHEIDDLVFDHATRDVAEIHHPATLGIQIAKEIDLGN